MTGLKSDRHPAQLPPEELEKQIHWETARGTGPGGQHRNKTDTAVRITHVPTGIRAQAGERRSLRMNRSRALDRLRRKLALEHRMPLPRHGEPPLYLPSELWRSRLKQNRVVVSPRHDDFPALLAEALDVLEDCGQHIARAAHLLETTTAQLVRFLALEPAALAAVNERRRARGQRPFQT